MTTEKSMSAARPLSAITEEIQFYKAQAGQCIVEIGRRLLEAKEQLPHGQWEDWLEKSVEFSSTTAIRFMKIASEYGSNPASLPDLPYTKLLSLLQLPPETREEFVIENHNINGQEKTVEDMTTRELQAAVKEKNEAIRAQKEAEQRLAEERGRAAQAEQEKEELSVSLNASRDTVALLRKNVAAKEDAFEALCRERDRLYEQTQRRPEISETEREALRMEGAQLANKANRRHIEALREELEAVKNAKVETVSEDEAMEASFAFCQTVRAAAEQLHSFFRLAPVDVAARELQLCAEQLGQQRDRLYEMSQRASNLALADEDSELPPLEEYDEEEDYGI